MKFKTLLLGSAAAFAAAGGAQAADLSIAEPVEFVRICDAFGTGYWYIPGTDTCIKIGGKVQFDIKFQSGGWVGPEGYDPAGSYSAYTSYYLSATGATNGTLLGTWFTNANGPGWSDSSGHSSDWKFVTEASVDFTAKSMTEYGPLVAYLKLKGVYDPDNSGVKLDGAYLSLGNILFGHTDSPANYSGGYSPALWHGDQSTNLIQLSFAAAGFGVQLGIEDPHERWGSETGVSNMPTLTGNVTFSGGHWNAKLIGGWADLDYGVGSVYGVGGTVDTTMGAFSLMVGGGYGTGSSFVGTPYANGVTQWTAFISGKVALGATMSVAGTFAYADADGMDSATGGSAKLVWAPVPGFEAYAEGKAWKYSSSPDHRWEGKVGVSRSF